MTLGLKLRADGIERSEFTKPNGTIEYRIGIKDEFGETKRKAFYGKTENECIASVTKQHLQLFLISITKYANSTIEKLFLQLKKAYQEAINQEIITKNLMLDADIRRPKSDKPDKKIRGYSTEEQKIFLTAIEEHKIPYGRSNYKRQLLIELYTGLRMGEINALRPEDVDLERKTLTVCRTISTGKDKKSFINSTIK